MNSGLPEKKTEHNFRPEVDTGDFYEQSRFCFLELIECATKAIILTQKISDFYGDPSISASILDVGIFTGRKQDVSGDLHIISPSPDAGTRIGFPIRGSKLGDYC